MCDGEGEESTGGRVCDIVRERSEQRGVKREE